MKRAAVLALMLCCFFCVSGSVQAEVYTSFLPALIDLPGWEAAAADGIDLIMPGMNMVTASRIYEQKNKELTAVIMVGPEMMVAGQTGIEIETPALRADTHNIGGFEAASWYDKANNAGSIVVYIDQFTDRGAYFIISFQGCSDREALDLTQKFDLNKIKTLIQAAK